MPHEIAGKATLLQSRLFAKANEFLDRVQSFSPEVTEKFGEREEKRHCDVLSACQGPTESIGVLSTLDPHLTTCLYPSTVNISKSYQVTLDGQQYSNIEVSNMCMFRSKIQHHFPAVKQY
jgi:hypothetical protein